MENASKALLIAGAILIVILLIGVGMMVYQGAMGTVNEGISSMNQQEKQAYNEKFERYAGTTKKGSDVRALIQDVMSNNSENKEVPEKIVGLSLGKGVCGNNADEKFASGEKTAENLQKELNQMSVDRSKVNSSALFTVIVERDIDTGLVNQVNVTKNSATK